uniref:Component of oligomeric Golgi complex 4 n=1 Tax=Aureoumbra lagunensis TaxID=44058 RepID=A0A7S3NKV8_9STRA|mmetsp:Transcript_1910/g.2899  ORF Transcript_1910/g.2899 Transcript_1910/m.2899 type:complete len:812 (+) Transcript_1910:34-2469(+)|eukprot:CAMPEP_0197314842 /NCGR_PEP_ID=MMETSP0891-20130614/35442_1 /TAXON_ID=44058 ORGANISM="Aureoumbra lagunensis, Strain CCMP1510" /NCGR_SAMPLE_ID=MMETSP0891 /ASSEMBLY_ACC=CAM_ASM_000534 /LENGTH=811 /DNA_ID=CAMNT_0042803477 /DNA_START=20 /DNA_END=2455 /DNA_ORIENTATION=+
MEDAALKALTQIEKVKKCESELERYVQITNEAKKIAYVLALEIRVLDKNRERAEKGVLASRDVLGLRSCAAKISDAIEEEKLDIATAQIIKLRKIEKAAEAGGDAYEKELAAGRTAALRAQQLIRERYFEACIARDGSRIEMYIEFLRVLDLVNDSCVSAFLDFFRYELRTAAALGLESNQDEKEHYLISLQKIVNAVFGVVQTSLFKKVCQAFEEAKSNDGGQRALLLAHDAAETALLAVCARFAAEQRLASLAASAQRRDSDTYDDSDSGAETLDALLEDTAVVLQRLETWDRFARHIASTIVHCSTTIFANTRLTQAAAELGGWYALLELNLLRNGLRLEAKQCFDLVKERADFFWRAYQKAYQQSSSITTNKKFDKYAEDDDTLAAVLEDTPISATADDGMYAIKRALLRAASTGHGGACGNILSETINILDASLLHDLSTTAHTCIAQAQKRLAKQRALIDLAAADDVDALTDAFRAGFASTADKIRGEATEEKLEVLCIRAQVAINTLQRAALELLPKLAHDVQLELGASFAKTDSRLIQLDALTQELFPPKGETAIRFEHALHAAVEAYAKLLLRPLAVVLNDKLISANSAGNTEEPTVGASDFHEFGAGFVPTEIPIIHRYAIEDDDAFATSSQLNDLAPVLTDAADALIPFAISALSAQSAETLFENIATGLGAKIETHIFNAPKITPLGAVLVDKDVRAIRTALVHAASLNIHQQSFQLATAIRSGLSRALAFADLLLQVQDLDDAYFYLSQAQSGTSNSSILSYQDLRDALLLRGFELAPPSSSQQKKEEHHPTTSSTEL